MDWHRVGDAMSELNDDEFMNMGTPPSAPNGEMSDDQFMNAGAPPRSQPMASRPIGEETFRQIGLAGRDIAGAVPMAVAGAGDLINGAVNYGTSKLNKMVGTNIPQLGMPTGDVQRGLSATGVFPEYENKTEKNIGTAADIMLGGGESGVNTIKEGASNALDYAKSFANPVKTGLTGVKALTPEQILEDAAQNKSDAGGIFNQMRANGATYGPEKTEAIRAAVNQAVSDPSFVPEMNPKTLGIVNKLNQVADSGKMDLSTLHQYRTLLSRVGGSEDGISAAAVKNAINQHVYSTTSTDLISGTPEAAELLRYGTAAYARAARTEDVAEVIAKAGGDPNRLKAGLTRFVNKPENLYDMNDEEKIALKAAASNTTTEKLLKMAGKFGIDLGTSLTPGNTALPAVTGAMSTIAAEPLAGSAIVAGGTLARQGQKMLARGAAQKAYDLVKNRQLPDAPSSLMPSTTSSAGVSGQAAGGRVHKKPIKKTRSGVVYARPKRYPAIEAMRSR